MANINFNCPSDDPRVIRYLDFFDAHEREEVLKNINSKIGTKTCYQSPEPQPFGVYSLTEEPTVIQMWSHYGNNHKGIGIGFKIDMSYVLPHLDEKSRAAPSLKNGFRFYVDTQGIRLSFALLKVKYVKDVVEISFDKFALAHEDKNTLDLLCWDFAEGKHENWAYEKEWRLVCFNKYSTTVDDLFGLSVAGFIKPSCVLLGCDMVLELKEIIREKYGKTYTIIECKQYVDSVDQSLQYSLWPNKELILKDLG